jgi:hypothetical protein
MPLFPPDANTGVIATLNEVLEENKTTTSSSYVNLLTMIADTHGANRYLLIRVSWSISTSTSNAGRAMFSLTVDGTEVAESGNEIFTCVQSGAMVAKVGPLTEGSHTVNVDWSRTVGGTIRCRPGTEPLEHCSIMASEVTA